MQMTGKPERRTIHSARHVEGDKVCGRGDDFEGVSINIYIYNYTYIYTLMEAGLIILQYTFLVSKHHARQSWILCTTICRAATFHVFETMLD